MNKKRTRISPQELEQIYVHVKNLIDLDERKEALNELCRYKNAVEVLAPILWQEPGAVTSLLEELVTIYGDLTHSRLHCVNTDRRCRSLALIQCMASHWELRHEILHLYIPFYVYPFLGQTGYSRSCEFLRLNSLGVIGSLVNHDDPEIIYFLVNSEVLPRLLRIIEHGFLGSKTLAVFALSKILEDEYGLEYVCATAERFYSVSTVLHRAVSPEDGDSKKVAPNVLRFVIESYLRLSDNPRGRAALLSCLPDSLRNNTFAEVFSNDHALNRTLYHLLCQLEHIPNVISPPSVLNVPI